MKIFIAVLSVLATAAYASAAPLANEQEQPIGLVDVDADGGMNADPNEPIVRERRLVCEKVTSIWTNVATPNHNGCAIKCVAEGRKGGKCQGDNCVCKTSKWFG